MYVQNQERLFMVDWDWQASIVSPNFKAIQKYWLLMEMYFPIMFSEMFLFTGGVSATKENIVQHIYFIMFKEVIIIQLNLY